MDRKRILIMLISIMLLSIIIIACGNTDTDTTGGNDQSEGSVETNGEDFSEVTLKLGYPVAEDTPIHIGAQRMAERIAEQTDGNFQIDLYPNDLLGSQRELIEGLEMGTTDMAISPATNLSTIFPKLNVFNLPFVFEDRDHVYSVADGEIGQEIYNELETETGIKKLAMVDSGFRHIGNSVRPIESVDDVEGLSLRAIDAPINIAMLEALGADATPMAFGELFTALQQGTVDGQDGPLANIYASRFYEVQPYLTMTDLYFAILMMTISESAWDELPSEYQEILEEEAIEYQNYQRELLAEEEEEYLEHIIDYGVEVTELTPENRQEFQEASMSVWEEFEDEVPADLRERVLEQAN